MRYGRCDLAIKKISLRATRCSCITITTDWLDTIWRMLSHGTWNAFPRPRISCRKPNKRIMNFIILDLEATCWQGNAMDRRQEVIELAAYHVNGYGEWGEHFNAFVKPLDHPRLSAYCTELTGITQEMVDKARRFDVVIQRFQDWLDTI